ncbi:MAG: alpha/beta hydrolase family protein, partial [Sulfuricella sp.]
RGGGYAGVFSLAGGKGRMRHRLALWIFVIFVMAALSGCPLPRAYESALVLADTVAGETPSRLKAKTPAPRRAPVAYSVDGRQRAADLYLPGENKPRAGLVLVPGAVPQSRNDPRIVAFAHTLARAGFAVLVPDMAGFRELAIHPRDAREVADAFAYLVSRPELAPAGRAGMAAFSYAVGPAVLAALEPDIRERVRFIVGVGGYHDLTRAVRFFTTGWFEHAGRWQAIAPDEYGQLVLVRSAKPYLASARDRILLETMVERRLKDRAAGLDDLAAQLGGEGRAVYALATNRDRDRFPALFDALPADMKRDIAALSLAGKDLSRLKARLILVHGRNDNLIPYPETLALANVVGRERARVFLIHRILGHVDLSLGHILSWPFWSEELPDAWRMGRAVYLLLSERADE